MLKSRKKILTSVGLLWLVAIAWVVWLSWKNNPAPVDTGEVRQEQDSGKVAAAKGKEYPPETIRKARQLRDLGIAQIENERYGESEKTFEELQKLLPEEPLCFQNRIIGLLLKRLQEQGSPEQRGGDQPVLEGLISQLKAKETKSGIGEYLAGQDLEYRKEFAAAAESYGSATTRNKSFLAAYAARAAALKRATRDTDREGFLRTLREASLLAPENLFIQLELLQGEVELKDKQAGGTVEQLEKLLGDFSKGIQERTRIDPLEMLSKMKEGVLKEDWAGAMRGARVLVNVLRPEEILQADRSVAVPHLSSLMLRDFDDSGLRGASPGEPIPAIAIEWKRGSAEGVGEISDVQDVRMEDFDLDGRLDLCVLQLKKVAVFSRGVEGETWKILMEAELPQGYQRLVPADLDNDFDENSGVAVVAEKGSAVPPCQSADPDVIVYGPAGIGILQNQYDRETRKRTLSMKPLGGGLNSQTAVRTAVVVDLDGDGDLDVVSATTGAIRLWGNTGGMDFYDLSDRSALPGSVAPNVIVAVDVDRDVDQDLLVIGGQSSGVLVNMRHGRFRWKEFPEREVSGFSSMLDVGVSDPGQGTEVTLLGTNGGVRFQKIVMSSTFEGRIPEGGDAPAAVEGVRLERIRLADFDNDGEEDAVAWHAGGVTVQMKRGGGEKSSGVNFPFEETFGVSGIQKTGGVDFGDVDRDGDLDLVWGDAEGVKILVNEGGNKNHWLDVSLIAQQIKEGGTATASGRVNSHGLGGLLELKSSRGVQSRIVERSRTHLGLGDAKEGDVLRVMWPNGIPGNLLKPEGNQFLCEQQTLKGSCPYLYAWNGEKVEFVTDLLWGAPIGLQLGEGMLAIPREWEFLKIPGESIAPHEGEYDLRITEELWEGAYFDQVRLYAVDHPAEVEIETNEKVGPASVAAERLFTARKRRLPMKATDSRGNDLLAQLSVEDDEYVGTFQKKVRQGLAEEHFLELDAGKLPRFEHLHLYLRGWLYPTDTSINVAVSRDSRLSPPKPPSIQVINREGKWEEVQGFCGFPGGKTKTVVYDLSKVFLTEDYRIRIVTNMEFYWDAAYFTVDEPGEKLEMTELPLLSSRLHYRGFSEAIAHRHNGPERYDYQKTSVSARWPSMEGSLTRYGDVKELIGVQDDRLVVMGAGDEMELRFGIPERKLPRGWKRDFVLYNVGWDKDADLNTISGTSLDPLPYRGMSSYPPVSGEHAPEGEEYDRYLSIYQTRTQSPRRSRSHVFLQTVDRQQ